MQGCREAMVSTQVRTYPGPNLAWELGDTICDYVDRDDTLSNDMFKDQPGQLRRVDILPARSVDCYFSLLVDNSDNTHVA
jgi:hypothetical protein